MRLTKRTNIALRLLMFCGIHSDRLATKAEIAEQCDISQSHLAQVINRLAQLGYLHTQRGRTGGLRLARPMREIVVGAVFRDLEAPGHPDDCLANTDGTCPLSNVCRLRAALTEAAEAFFARLDRLTLDELICDNVALEGFFIPELRCARRIETETVVY